MLFTNKVHSKSWSSTNVSPSVVVTTTTLQNFALALFWSLPSNLHNSLPCFIKLTSFNVFLAQTHPVGHSLIHSPNWLFTRTWSNCRLSRFPLKIAHFWRETNLPSRNLHNSLQDCAILPANPPRRIFVIFPINRLSSQVFAQIWATVNCSSYKLHKPLGQPAQLPVRNVHFSPAIEQSLACAAELTGSLRDRAKLPCMHGMLLPRIILETSHQVSLSLDLWHARHNLNVIKTHQLEVSKLILHINLTALKPHITSRSSRHI